MKKQTYTTLLSLLLLVTACQDVQKDEPSKKIIIREKNDAATLNAVAVTDQFSAYASMQIFQTLTNIDYKSEEIVGLLATAAPKISYDSVGKMITTYTLRENATFGKGLEVQLEDILFSLKLNFCPIVSNAGGANYYDFIEKFSPIGERTFTITCASAAVLNELRSGDFFVLPRVHYDSLNLLQNFSLQRLKTDASLESNDSIIRFAESFNSSLTQTNPEAFIGSGPYQLKKWQKGQRVILERKKEWWGNAYKNENTFFIANADELQFEIITDNQTAINALKAGEVDVLNYVTQNDYEKIEDSENFKTLICNQHGFNYIGFNCNHPILREREFRKAIELIVPYEKIIEVAFQNQATLNRLPLALQQTELRNDTLSFSAQNLEKAKSLLKLLNWVDSNNDGTLDKMIEGEKVECELQYHYNTGNDQRKAIGYMLKNELKKVGIKLQVNELEWLTYLKTLRSNEVQLFMSAKLTLPITPDFTGMLHSSSANGGRNYANYQNPELDVLIDSILMEPNLENRKVLINKVQEIVAQDVPYVFLASTKTRFVHSKKLKNVPIYNIRPHYWAPELY